MKVKHDTKEKFHVITILESAVSANMTDGMEKAFSDATQNDVKNLIIDASEIKELDREVAEKLVSMQQISYENGHSFVICCLTPTVESFLDQEDLLEIMNVTPTLSEAMDIVQMEEIERELFND